MRGLELSTREGDGHVVVALCGEPDIAGVATPLAAAAAREPQLIVNRAGLRFPGSSVAAALARGRQQGSSWPGRADDEYPARPARVTYAACDRAGRRKEHGMNWIATWRRAWSYDSFATS